MGLLDSNEKVILCITVILFIGILIINFLLISINQKKITFFHPGWLLNCLIMFYGLTTPIYILLKSKEYYAMNSLFINLYSFEKFWFIFILYFIVIFVFTFCEVIILFCLKDKKKVQFTDADNLKGWEYQSFIVVITILITILFGSILYHISLFGGFDSEVILNKVTRYENPGGKGFSIPYTPLYQTIFLFWFFYLIKNNLGNIKRQTVFWVSFLFFTGFILYMGTTLQVLMVVLGMLFILFVFKKEFILRRWKKVTFILFLLAIVFEASQNYRDIKLGINDMSLKNLIQFPDLTRFETITGYVPGLVLLSDESIFSEITISSFILSMFPNSIKGIVTEQSFNLTDLIHNSSANTAYGTYTVTMPISLYSALGLIGLTLSVFIIYLVTFQFIYYCFIKGNYFIFIATILFCNTFYLVRLDTAAWLGKLRLDIFLVIGIITITLFFHGLLRSYFRRKKNGTVERKYKIET